MNISINDSRINKSDFNLLFVTATDIETNTLHEYIHPIDGEEEIFQIAYENQTYYLGTIANYNCIHLQCQMGYSQPGSSIISVGDAINVWRPKLIFMVGIAFGSDDKKQSIGDVLISECVVPYDIKRMGKKNFHERGEEGYPSVKIINRLKNHKTWKFFHNIDGKVPKKAELFFGTILSGEKLIDNKEYRNSLLEENPTAIGGEMEGYGVFSVSKSKGIEWVIVKSICDFADGKKAIKKIIKQQLAAKTSIDFVVDFLNNELALEEYKLAKKKKRSSEYDKYIAILMNNYTKKGVLGDSQISLNNIYINSNYKYINSHDIINNLNNDVLIWCSWKKEIDQTYKNDAEIKMNNFLGRFENPNLLLILGHPGQGKTSFCYKLLYDLGQSKKYLNKKVFFLKLRYFHNIDKLFEEPFEAIIQELNEKPFFKDDIEGRRFLRVELKDFENSIIILDGLDELQMSNSKKLTYSDVDDWCKTLSSRMESEMMPSKIIITSRYYLDISNIERHFPIFTLAELNLAQQENWLRNYNKFSTYKSKISEENLTKIYTLPQFRPLKELITQPILLYLVARSGINTDGKYNKAKIYEELFNVLIEKFWDDNNGNSGPIKNLKGKDLRSLLRHLGFELYLTGEIYLPKERVLNILNKYSFSLSDSHNNPENQFKALMVAFYFQSNESLALEFMHKSLGEYLAAEKIWESINIYFNDQLTTTFDIINEFDYLFADKLLTVEIIDYLREIILNDNEKKERLFQNLMKHFQNLFNQDFVNPNTKNNLSSIINKFYGFFSILVRVGAISNTKQDVKILYTYLRILTHKEKVLNLSGINLKMGDLSQMNLSDLKLIDSDFSGANFTKTDLSGSDLSFSHFGKANFLGADLSNVNFGNEEQKQKTGFTKEQLEKVYSLKNCSGLLPSLRISIESRL